MSDPLHLGARPRARWRAVLPTSVPASFVMLLVAGAVILDGVVARSFVWPMDLAPRTVQRGSFQSLGGVVVLALDPDMRRWMAPDVGIYRGGVLAVPTGRSVVLPLGAGVSYHIRNASRTRAPYVLLGSRRALNGAQQFDHVDPHGAVGRVGGGPAFLSEPRVLAPSGNGVGWLPWGARPWAADNEWLAGLSQRCASAGGRIAFSVQRTGKRIVVQLGRCTAETLAPTEEDDDLSIAVLAGPDTATVVKTGGTWEVTPAGSPREVATALAFVTLGSLVLGAGMGPIGAAAVAVVLAALSLWWPFQALLTFVLTTPLAAVAGLVRLAHFGWRSRRGARAALGGLALVAGIAAFAAVGTRLNLGTRLSEQEDRRFQELCGWRAVPGQVAGKPPLCLLTGYSTAADMGVGFGVEGTYGTLASECPICADAIARVTCPGMTFAFIRDLLCSASPPVAAGGRIVFLGGDNDDWMWSGSSSSLRERVGEGLAGLALLFNKIQLTSPSDFQPIETDPAFPGGRAGVAKDTRQGAAFEAAAACAERRRAPLWVFHDFLASDLAGGRTEIRSAFLALRREAVERHSGKLVDLLEALRDRAGVSWFNDMIHFSAVGHHEVARLVCSRITAPVGEQPPPVPVP